MKLTFKEDQTEEFYRKLLLLDKVKPLEIGVDEKEYIFYRGYCWDILLKDEDAPWLCYFYARHIICKRFPEGENILMNSGLKNSYLSFLISIGEIIDIVDNVKN